MPLTNSDVLFVDRHYGKNYVRLLYVKRAGNVHHIKEIEVNTDITLNDAKDFLHGDNSDIVATDSQKNTVYILAKKYGVRSIEEFAMKLSNHFLSHYNHVTAAHVYIEERPWKRAEIGGKEHVHAFVQEGGAIRTCDVRQSKHGQPQVTSGIKGLQVLKTTKSAFVNFVRDEFRSLPDMDDRIFCTIVEATWNYSTLSNLDFDQAWTAVKETVMEVFAGPADTGVDSPSVQKTLYDTQMLSLDRVPQMDTMAISLPNVHAYAVDFNKFPAFNFDKVEEVFQPVDKPSGNISATLSRKVKSRL